MAFVLNQFLFNKNITHSTKNSHFWSNSEMLNTVNTEIVNCGNTVKLTTTTKMIFKKNIRNNEEFKY